MSEATQSHATLALGPIELEASPAGVNKPLTKPRMVNFNH